MIVSKMRTMTHNGRAKRDGRVYDTRHNDRDFDVKTADNIDPERLDLNQYWHLYMNEQDQIQEEIPVEKIYIPMNWRLQTMIDEATGSDYAAQDKARFYEDRRARRQASESEPSEDLQQDTFSEVELRFYNEKFGDQLRETNAGYVRNRHPERVRTMEEWKRVKRNAPEESILQIGKMEEHADPDKLMECFLDYTQRLHAWNEEHGKPFTMLSYAMHADEDGAPHIHSRRVWHYQDKDGVFRIGQEKALEAAGVQLPDPDQKVGRRNNRKMTFDKMTRQLWLDVLKEHGLDIEREPVPDGKHNREKEEMIRDKYEAMLQEAEKAQEDAERIARESAEQAERAKKDLAEAKSEIERLTREKNQAILESKLVTNHLEKQEEAYLRNKEILEEQEDQMKAAEKWMSQIQDWPSYEAESMRAFHLLDDFRKAMQDFFGRPWPWRDRRGEKSLLEVVQTLRDKIMVSLSAMTGYEQGTKVPPELQRSKVIIKSLDEMTQEAAKRVTPQKAISEKTKEIEI